uniref:Uncharacterized protein n=1 Tax=Knipowitschia caucasica TaxID=637954 RepID=A0AAV2K2L5_KNICA
MLPGLALLSRGPPRASSRQEPGFTHRGPLGECVGAEAGEGMDGCWHGTEWGSVGRPGQSGGLWAVVVRWWVVWIPHVLSSCSGGQLSCVNENVNS